MEWSCARIIVEKVILIMSVHLRRILAEWSYARIIVGSNIDYYHTRDCRYGVNQNRYHESSYEESWYIVHPFPSYGKVGYRIRSNLFVLTCFVTCSFCLLSLLLRTGVHPVRRTLHQYTPTCTGRAYLWLRAIIAVGYSQPIVDLKYGLKRYLLYEHEV